jgi:hypothetical protein
MLIQTQWTHNPTEGNVIGYLVTKPIFLGWANTLTATAFIKDSSKCTWRIRANAELAILLSTFEIGQKLKLTGIKGNLCPGAWDDAKRQIVPYSIEPKRPKPKITRQFTK